MSDGRLPAGLEVSALVRRAQAYGDFATILRKGDPDRGALILLITHRGRHVAVLERVLDFEVGYRWTATGPAESASPSEVSDFIAGRTRFDEDCWVVELDIAEPERFIAETTASG